jgi:dihydrodipicolinate synthase/N-acetylneuraminate lyase
MTEPLLTSQDLRGVFAVPPLARRSDASRSIDFEQNKVILDHILAGGITRAIYGGNAFLYHIQLKEFEELLEWLSVQSSDACLIPSIGPSYGRAVEQARLLKRYGFTTAMILPCADPRDAVGLEVGYREIAEAGNIKLIVYLKDETNFGTDTFAGLDAVARLVDDGFCVGIKYAVVRNDPTHDPYLEALLSRVSRDVVISGIGERPAVIHLRDWKLSGFTTGSGCIAPKLSEQLFEALVKGDYDLADLIRSRFIPLEDLRDKWGPARVLHHATELAEIAKTGPIAPYITALSDEEKAVLLPVVEALTSDHRVSISRI